VTATTASQPRTVTTRIAARLDRLPWSRFHWRVVIALREAVREARVESLPDHIHAPPGRSAVPGEERGTSANRRQERQVGGDGR
jgi:hypothetical protein